ncbi:hypothetical protein [Variovorax sp. dw_954]|uniref:hypothetical protein n=1 Tax=unclassified Variovorax TaxID=663243 RepID=UPI001BD35CFD
MELYRSVNAAARLLADGKHVHFVVPAGIRGPDGRCATEWLLRSTYLVGGITASEQAPVQDPDAQAASIQRYLEAPIKKVRRMPAKPIKIPGPDHPTTRSRSRAIQRA